VLGPQLDRLPAQQRTRQANIEYFESQLQSARGLGFLKPEPRITRTAPYSYVLKYFAEQARDIPRAAFVAALQLEGIPCDGLFYEPVYRSSLFPVNPAEFPALSWGREKPLDLRNMYHCPASERAAYHEAIWFPHYLFLSERKEIDTIIEAIFKALDNIEELRGLEHQAIRNQGLSRADRES
jgi:dTDP-4-amino-4,6-dideoxygalactose transaminase